MTGLWALPNARADGFTARTSILRGLIVGLLIAALQIAGGHAWFDYQKVSVHGNGLVAVAGPVFLLPLAIAWGWTWVSDRWSGRSGPRLLLFTVGLVFGAASAFPLQYVLFPPATESSAATFVDFVLLGLIFVMPVVAIAALLFWAFASQKVSV